MPRSARLKLEESEAWYHLCARAAAKHGEFPLADPAVKQKLMQLIKHYAGIYFCEIAVFEIMDNHYHNICRFDAPRELSAEELMERALALYPDSRKVLECWPEAKWKRLQERLFNVSEFMRNVQGAFATWYNRTFNRKGHFWGDRFKSTLLVGPEAVLEAALYVELNAVRAGLVECPEEYRWGSLYLREAGHDSWLLPLSEILHEPGDKNQLHRRFKELCYYRGAVITKQGQVPISEETIRREEARGFKQRGVYRKKLRCFTDGLILGSQLFIYDQLTKLRKKGWFKRRKNPVKQLAGAFFSLREQRSNFVEMETETEAEAEA